MKQFVKGLALIALIAFATPLGLALAQAPTLPASSRVALVIGNGAYGEAPLPSAPNDAGLVAQTLAAAGFDVTGARDLGAEALRRAFRDFLGKAAAAGPQGTALVYLAGHALQFDGDNYFVPVDATLEHDADLPIETVRLADFTRALAGLRMAAAVVIVDGAYADSARRGNLAVGLVIADADPGTLLAFNAAPGTIAPVAAGPYGTYATILTQTMKQGGVPVEEVFDRVRVGVNTASRGAVVPWNASRLSHSFNFFDRAPDAPALGSAQIPFASLRSRPLRDFTPEQAYDVALARDTFPAYQDYLTVFPDSPLAKRVRVLLAARREALFWRDALKGNAPAAFWTYLRRYPRGPHVAEAQRRLARLSAAVAPPPGFAPLAFDTLPPPEAEYAIIERGFVFADTDSEPPPPPPIFLLPPLPPELALLPPPAPAPMRGFLPIPMPMAIPHVQPVVAPGGITPPRGFKGAYAQPRPFMAAPANGGLLPQAGRAPQPQPEKSRAQRPAATGPGNALPLPSDSPQGASSANPLPVPHAAGGRLNAPPVGVNQRGGTPPAPAPLPVPGTPPVQPAGPIPPASSAGVPTRSPPGDVSERKHKGPRPSPPIGALPPPQAAPNAVLPPLTDVRNPTRPRKPGGPAPLPASTAAAPKAPAALSPATVTAPDGQPLLRQSGKGQHNPDIGRPPPQPQAGPRPQPPASLAPALARPDLQPRPREPLPRPQPPAPGGLPRGGAPPGGQPPASSAGRENPNRRPECGHPGQPPCRP